MNRLSQTPATENVSLPRPPAPVVTPQGFVAVAMAANSPEQLAVQQYLYQVAFAEAQAVARPSLPERDLAGVWN